MTSAPDVERFKSNNWEECHDFIAAIRARALWEGKQRDAGWMADFATPLFWGKALSWHGRLPQDVRQDWFKLEAALLDRWSPPEDDDEPTPAAAPPVNHNDEASRPLQGVLKAVIDGPNATYYVWLNGSSCNVTTDATKAIHVRCNSVSGATLLERIDNSSHYWLAVHWATPSPKIGKGSFDYAYMTLVNQDTLKSSWGARSPSQPSKVTILANGEVTPLWTKDDGSKITLSGFVGEPFLYLTPDPEAYARNNPDEIRTRFFIAPID